MNRRRVFGWIVVVVANVAVWLTIRPSYFFADDFVNFSVADEMGLSTAYLNRDIFGHWLPGRRLLDWALGSLEPVPWLLVISLEVALLAVSCVLVERIVRKLTGSATLAFLAAAWLPLTSAIPATAQWWSAGSLSLSALPLLLGACLLGLSYADRPAASKLVGVAILVGTAPLFDERSAAIAVAFPFLLAVLGRIRGRRLVSLLGATTVAIGIWYLAQRHFTAGTVTPPHSSPREIAEFVARGFGQSWLPSLAGVHVRPAILGSGGLWFGGAVVAVIIVALVVAARSARALLIVCWMAGTAAVVFLPVAAARAHEFRPSSALEPRYSAILMPFAIVALTCIVAEVAERHSERVWSVVGWSLLAVMLLMAVVPGMMHLSRHTIGRESRAYADNINASADEWPQASFYDVIVPPFVVPAAFIPQSFLSRVLPTMVGPQSTIVVTETALLPGGNGSAPPSPLPQPHPSTVVATAGVTEETVDGLTCYQADVAGTITLATTGVDNQRRHLLQLRGRLGPDAAGIRFLVGPDPDHLGDATDGAGFQHAPVPTDVWTVAIGLIDSSTIELRIDASGPLCISGASVGTP